MRCPDSKPGRCCGDSKPHLPHTGAGLAHMVKQTDGCKRGYCTYDSRQANKAQVMFGDKTIVNSIHAGPIAVWRNRQAAGTDWLAPLPTQFGIRIGKWAALIRGETG